MVAWVSIYLSNHGIEFVLLQCLEILVLILPDLREIGYIIQRASPSMRGRCVLERTFYHLFVILSSLPNRCSNFVFFHIIVYSQFVYGDAISDQSYQNLILVVLMIPIHHFLIVKFSIPVFISCKPSLNITCSDVNRSYGTSGNLFLK